MQPNKNRTHDNGIFSAYTRICEASGESHLAPEYRVAPQEVYTDHEGDSTPLAVHAVYVKMTGEKPTITDSCKITPEDWCPECCINELLDHEGEHMLTADDMNTDYKIAQDSQTIFIEKNDRSEYFVFVKHKQ